MTEVLRKMLVAGAAVAALSVAACGQNADNAAVDTNTEAAPEATVTNDAAAAVNDAAAATNDAAAATNTTAE